MSQKFSINSNTIEIDRVDNRITQYFSPSARYNSPIVVTPTDPTESGVLKATLTYGDLIGSDSIFINTNGSELEVVITLPPVEDIFALFSYPIEGSTRSWNIGYDCGGVYNIVSPDVINYNGNLVQLFQNPQCISLISMTIMINPYGDPYPQDYGLFVTSSSSLSNITSGYSSNVIVGGSYYDRNSITGDANVIIGRDSGCSVTSAYNNVLIGYAAGGHLTTADENIMIGYCAGLLSTTGSSNTMIGATAGFHLTTGQNNTLIGVGACHNATTASGNVCVGNDTLENIRVGVDNTIIGNSAGNGFIGDSTGCIAIGAGSAGGPGLFCVNSTYIGVGAIPSGNVTNEVVIGTELQGKGTDTTTIGGVQGCYFYSPCLAAVYSSTIDSATNTIFWNGIILRGMDPSTNYQYLNFKTAGIYEIEISGALYTAGPGTAVVTFYKNGEPGFFIPLTIQTAGGTFSVSGSSMGIFLPGDSCYFLVSNNVVSDPAMLCYCNIKYLSMF
jgi:hypothetical protein